MKRFVLVNKTKGVYDISNPIGISDLIPLGGGHDDTSEMASINNSGGTVIQSLSVDEFGHIVSGGSINLDGRYLKSFTESDPTVPSHVKSITTTQKNNWNAAHSWGNHATQNYLKTFTESDPTVPSHVKGITTSDIQKWNTVESQDNKIRTISIDPASLPNEYTKADVAAKISSLGLTISSTEIIIVKMESGLEPETDAYIARVEADGGTIVDRIYVDLAYKLLKAEGRINQDFSWLSASMGVKKDINNKVSKLYSLKGAAFDLITVGTGASSITWSATGQDNAPEILVDKTVSAAMKPSSAFTMPQPNTIFSVVSVNYQSSNQYVYDGFSSTGRHLLLRNNSNAWTVGTNSYVDITQTIGTSTHIVQANYIDNIGSLYVDNATLGTSIDLGSHSFEYITLFNYHGNDKQYNMGGKFKDLLVLGSGVTSKDSAFTQFFNAKYNTY